MKIKAFGKIILTAIVLMLSLVFVAKFGGPAILRSYIEIGLGPCAKIPIFCMSPEDKKILRRLNREFAAGLLPYDFADFSLSAPKGFAVIQHQIKKVYYKRGRRDINEAVIYALYQPPGFFITLFPQLKKQGIDNDYEFIRRIMYARLENVENITGAFFVIMKGVFTPDLGNQHNVKMQEFRIADKKGFINYNLEETEHYFDCNIFDKKANFFKIYIKDKKNILDLDKILTIIARVKAAD